MNFCSHNERIEKIKRDKEGQIRDIYYICLSCNEIIKLPMHLYLNIISCSKCRGTGFYIEFNRVIPCNCTNINNYIKEE